jgi:Ca2+-binding EF-hand superfamily protein
LSAVKFQSLFKNTKKIEKSSEFTKIISNLAHKSFANNQLENEVDQFFLYVDSNKDGFVSPQEVDDFYASMGYELSDEELAYGFLLQYTDLRKFAS